MYSLKKCVIALSINMALVSSGFTCTTFLAGNEAEQMVRLLLHAARIVML